MIVVTGGAGFIGSAVIWQLNARGSTDIVVVDTAITDAKKPNLAGLNYERFEDKHKFLQRLLNGEYDGQISTLIHMGACSSTTCTDIGYLETNNFEYTKHLAQFALRTQARFVYASSAATYGDGSHGYDDDEAQLHTLEPLNGYAHSKQQFDLWAQSEGALDQIVGLKYFNVFGPNEYHKGDMRSMVCKGYAQVRDVGMLRLFQSDRPAYPDGGQERDFIYVKDAVDMTLYCVDHRDVNGIFNVGLGVANTWNTLATSIFHALDLEPHIEYFPMPQHLQGKYQYHTQAVMGKLRSTGYTQQATAIQDAIRDYVQQYLVPGRCLATPVSA